MTNIYISPKYKIDAKQRRVNFTNDRADFERFLSALNCKAVEYYSALRTDEGYSVISVQQLFNGWLMKCDSQRNIIEFPLIQPEPPVLEPSQVIRDVFRTPSIWWGDTEFKSPGRQEFGVSIGYTKVTGNLWPVAVDLGTGQIIYEDHHTLGAEYIDVVAVGSFDMDRDGFETAMREAANFTTEIMSNRYVMVKTHLTLRDPKYPDSIARCELVRLTITHDDFLSDQARWKYGGNDGT